VFQGLLLFCLLGADLFVNYRVRRRSLAPQVH
jgi:simple sugar transport system permease protein